MSAKAMCPRCGYDLTGLVESWREWCPLGATCAECGLEFRCGNVLSPRLLGPGWSYEHTPGARKGRFWRASWAALRPWALCSTLSVDHRVHAWRAARFGVLWLVYAHAALVALTLGWAVWSGATRVSLVGLYASASGVVAGLMDRPRDAAWAVLFPYGAPRDVALARPHVPLLPVVLLTYVPTLLMPVWMTVLGETFAAARVRRVHLVRGLAYSIPGAVCFALGLAALGWTVLGVLPRVRGAGAQSALGFLMMGAVLAFPLYHGVWWYLFIRWYLRLRHAAGVVLVLMIPSALAVVILLLWAHNARWRA